MKQPLWKREAKAKPLVIAHRGASRTAPENSLLAFRAAVEQGADGVELDVFCCASGEVIVFHDADLTRWGGGKNDLVSHMTWQDLQKISLGQGQAIPLLEEVLAALAGDSLINIELKTAPSWKKRILDRDLPAKVASLIANPRDQLRVLVSSFDPLLLGRFQKQARQIPTALLFAYDQSTPLRQAWGARWLHPFALHPEAELVNHARLLGWRKAGYQIHAWTVNCPMEIARLRQLDIDALITDDPGLVKRLLTTAATRADVELW